MNNNDYISTRRKRIRYNFITPNTVVDEKPGDTSINFFYQISTFPNPYDHKYHLRKYAFNSKHEFINVKYYKLTRKQYKNFRRKMPLHKYKCFNTYTLKNINLPTLFDILTSQSNILETNYMYSGFAPFHKY